MFWWSNLCSNGFAGSVSSGRRGEHAGKTCQVRWCSQSGTRPSLAQVGDYADARANVRFQRERLRALSPRQRDSVDEIGNAPKSVMLVPDRGEQVLRYI